MTIHIEALQFDVIIGLLDFEREKQQRVIVDLEASYDYKDGQFIDYADITLLIENDLKLNKYELLEEALLGIKVQLFLTYPKINTLHLKITKPHILKQCEVAMSHNWVFEENK
ncbi:MAG: dihydroneopterin aldolase [Sulfurovum sp.]|nr:dihydroneopterin aldolase [Sulfurovum sp.]